MAYGTKSEIKTTRYGSNTDTSGLVVPKKGETIGEAVDNATLRAHSQDLENIRTFRGSGIGTHSFNHFHEDD